MLDEGVSQSDAEEELVRLNNDDNIDGIIMAYGLFLNQSMANVCAHFFPQQRI